MNTATLPAPPTQAPALTRQHWTILAVCFLVALIDGFDTLMLAFIAPLIGKQFQLAPTAVGQLFAAGYLGAVIGALGIGPLSDRFGRKRMLLVSLCIIVVFTFLCSRAASLQSLMVLRLLAGLGLGGGMPTLIALAAESVPASHRNRAVTWMFMGYPLGAVVGGSITAAALQHGWQVIFVGGALAALSMIPLVAWGLPESLPGASVKADRKGAFASLGAQFADGRALSALLLWLGLFSIMIASYFLVSWMPSVLVHSGFAPKEAAVVGVLLNIGSVTGALLLSFAVKRYGPWLPVVGAFIAGTLMVLVLGSRIGNPEGLWVLVFITGMCIFGGQLSTPALSAQLFPAPVRGAGTGWAMGIGRIGSIVGPALGGVLMSGKPDMTSLFELLAVTVGVAALAIGLSAFLRPAAGRD